MIRCLHKPCICHILVQQPWTHVTSSICSTKGIKERQCRAHHHCAVFPSCLAWLQACSHEWKSPIATQTTSVQKSDVQATEVLAGYTTFRNASSLVLYPKKHLACCIASSFGQSSVAAAGSVILTCMHVQVSGTDGENEEWRQGGQSIAKQSGRSGELKGGSGQGTATYWACWLWTVGATS